MFYFTSVSCLPVASFYFAFSTIFFVNKYENHHKNCTSISWNVSENSAASTMYLYYMIISITCFIQLYYIWYAYVVKFKSPELHCVIRNYRLNGLDRSWWIFLGISTGHVVWFNLITQAKGLSLLHNLQPTNNSLDELSISLEVAVCYMRSVKVHVLLTNQAGFPMTILSRPRK